MLPSPTRAVQSLAVLSAVILAAACGEQAAVTAPAPGARAAAVAAADATPPSLVITEFMADPAKVADSAGEWVELYNPGDSAVDLRGWQLVSGPSATPTERHTVATSVVVPARGFVLLGNNPDPALNGGAPVAYSYAAAIALNNSNTDWLALKRPDGSLADSVAYSASTFTGTTRTIGTPTFTPAGGVARIAVDLAVDRTVVAAGNWRAATTAELYGMGDRGTPGTGSYGPVVPAGPVTSVVVSPASTTVGGTTQLRAVAFDSASRAASTTFTWSSDDSTIAKVDSATGVATAVGGGSVVVRATAANGVSGAGTLSISVPGGTARLTFSGRNLSDPALPVGFEDQIFASAFDANGTRLATALTWSTTTPELVSVDQNGVVRAKAPGRASVTARAADGFAAAWTVLTADAAASATARYAGNAEFGEPTDADARDDFIVRRDQYTLSYNRARGGPNWVSYDLEATHFGSLDRCDCFSPDPALPADFPRVQTSDYTGGGYDRGHLVRSFDRTAGVLDNATTFYTTNILPQAADNNQGPWAAAEDSLGKLARLADKEVYVITGGAGSLGTVRGEGRITIPAFVWKVAVVLPRDRGLADVRSAADVDEVIAIVLPNTNGIRNVPWTSYKVSVDSVQRLTGYDLLAKLPDNVERQLETGDRPPVADAGGNDAAGTAYVGDEGEPVAFRGSATDPDAGDVLTYAWDFGDGTTGAGAAPTHAYRDDGSYTATLTVTDAHGVSDSAAVPVRVRNAAPTVGAFAGATILQGERFASAGAFADPGADTWTATVGYGDGPAEPLALAAQSFALAHTYATPGTRTVTVTVRDDDGGVGTRSATVVVQSSADGVRALLDAVGALRASGALAAGNAAALSATLNATAGQLARGERASAVSTLASFRGQVADLRAAGRLPAGDADRLDAYADRVVRSIGA
jgi:DNA/RNA endonuclease G (NUC1)/PKD repeat protein